MKLRLSAGLLGAVFAMVAAAQTPAPAPTSSKDMREAIAFERNKDAADARQAQLEVAHPRVTNPTTTGSADRSMDDSAQGQAAGEQAQKPVFEGMRQAIAFERAKDAADARQARLEAKHPSVTYSNANRSADRTDETAHDRIVKDPGPTVRKDK